MERLATGFQFRIRAMLLALVPIAVLCVWPGRPIVSHLTRQYAFKQIRATNGVTFEAERGFALKLDRSQLVHLATLSDVGALDLAQSSITDEQLSCLRPLRNLFFLDLSQNAISDVGFASVAHCEKLRGLVIQDTEITSDGLKHVTRMQELENLYLDGTPIDDDGLVHLRNCKLLREVSLFDTNVTEDGVKHLRALPNLSMVSLPKEWTPKNVAYLKTECPNLTVIQERVTLPR